MMSEGNTYLSWDQKSSVRFLDILCTLGKKILDSSPSPHFVLL